MAPVYTSEGEHVFGFDLYEYEQDDTAGVTLPRGTRTWNDWAPQAIWRDGR